MTAVRLNANILLKLKMGCIITYKGIYFATILPEHVGQRFFRAFRKFPLGTGFGTIMLIDVGKQIFMQDNVACIENNDQRDLRQAKEVHHAVTGE